MDKLRKLVYDDDDNLVFSYTGTKVPCLVDDIATVIELGYEHSLNLPYSKGIFLLNSGGLVNCFKYFSGLVWFKL